MLKRPWSTTTNTGCLSVFSVTLPTRRCSERKKEDISRQTVEIADRVVDKQMRIVQEIASLLGETAAETKIALYKAEGVDQR